MLLAIDIGNTNIIFAVYEQEEKKGLWRCATDVNRTADEYAVWLKSLMTSEDIDITAIDDAILASVVPSATFHLIQLCRKHFNCSVMEVGQAGVDSGMKITVSQPEEVGADRLVNALSAVQTYQKPLIVIDFGTATTFDVVDEKGQYCGGVIAPGIQSSVEALHHAAEKLPKVDIVKPDSVIGSSTVSAMQSGIFWGYISMIEGLVTRIKKEFGQDNMTIIATGGLAGLFATETDTIQHIDPDLTLRGLLLIHKQNQS